MENRLCENAVKFRAAQVVCQVIAVQKSGFGCGSPSKLEHRLGNVNAGCTQAGITEHLAIQATTGSHIKYVYSFLPKRRFQIGDEWPDDEKISQFVFGHSRCVLLNQPIVRESVGLYVI